MAKPSWYLGDEPDWYLGPSREPASKTPSKDAASTLPPVAIRSASNDGLGTMYGRFSAPGEWAEIRSVVEGQFMERMAPGAFERTITETKDQIRVLFHHGHDPHIGFMVLGPIRELQTDTSYEVDLFDTDYNHRLLPGLRAGQYGASFRFKVIKDELRQHPERSDHNPKALPEITVTEAELFEFGPTPTPAYKGASAAVRSSAGSGISQGDLRSIAHRLTEGERWAERAKPGDPGVLERERVGIDQRASWETRGGRAWWYLPGSVEAPRQARESWRL